MKLEAVNVSQKCLKNAFKIIFQMIDRNQKKSGKGKEGRIPRAI